MPVPSVITDLSTTAASNSPAGTDPPNASRTRGDDLEYAFLVYLRDNGML